MDVLGTVMRVLLGAPCLFFLPGYLLDRLVLGERSVVHGLERHTLRIVVSVLLTGWIALILAELGVFRLWLLIALVLLVCGGVWLRLQRSGRAPQFRAAPPLGIVAGHVPSRTITSFRAALAAVRFEHVLLAIVLIFAVLVARPFEVVRGGLDAGVYANTGAAIARTGGIVQRDQIVADIGARAAAGDVNAQHLSGNIFGVQNGERYLATRLRAAGFLITTADLPQGRVVPQFLHLWPTWIAVFVAIFGPTLGLVATGAAGMLGVLLIGLIGRRLASPLVGILAAAFLALMTPQVWFSRMSVSEAFTQMLILAGLWSFMLFADVTDRRGRVWWGAIVGAAFGELALTRIDSFLTIGPLVALLLYAAWTRRWDRGYTALAAVFGALLLHTALHVIWIARAYVIDTGIPTLQKTALTINLVWPLLSDQLRQYSAVRPNSYVGDWSRLLLELALLSVPVVGLLLLRRWPRPVFALERFFVQQRRALLLIVVIGLGGLAFWAYLIRPGIINGAVLRDPFSAETWLRLQGYVGAPINPPFDRYPQKPVVALALANMVRLGWYLSPLGVVLGVIGGVRIWWRIDRRTWLFAVVATVYALFYINSLQGQTDQTYIYILRRFVPIVYPALAVGMAVAVAAIAGSRSATPRRPFVAARTLASAALTIALLLFFVVTGRNVYTHVEYGGALAQIAALDRRFQPNDVILVRGGDAGAVAVRDTSEFVATPLTYMFGRNALPVKGAEPAKYAAAFGDQVTRWRAEGRRVFVLLAASGGDLVFPGYTPRSVATWTLDLREFQQLTNQKPKLSYTNSLPFHLYELVPEAAAAPTMLNYNDTAAQVAGFYRSEQPRSDQLRAAWTNGNAILRLPASAQGQTLRLDVMGGVRPRSIGQARLFVDVAAEPVPYPDNIAAVLPWRELTSGTLGENVQTITVAVPDIGATGNILVRLRSEPWVPANVPPDPGAAPSADRRPLGVRFVQAAIE